MADKYTVRLEGPVAVPLPTVVRTCKFPCYDCPFTKEAAPCQTAEQLADNVHRTLHAKAPQHCHHSLLDISEGKWLSISKMKPTVCAGHMILLEKLGVFPEKDLNGSVIDSSRLAATRDDRVVDSIEELVRLGTILNRLPESRYWYWWALQPVNVRLRIAARRKLDPYGLGVNGWIDKNPNV